MTTGLVIVLVGVALVATLALVVLLGTGRGSARGGLGGSYKNLKASQRFGSGTDEAEGARGKKDKPNVFTAVGGEKKVATAKLTLTRRLKYAQLPIPVVAFHTLEVGISIVTFIIVSLYFNVALQLVALLAGPILMRWIVNTLIDRRMKRFDADYPQFLLSLVGLLKTGMNPIQALEAAASGLEPTSLVREEVEMMIERLRLGVSEDKSIGAFGEDIYHSEIELFVQALLLSRRVGGTLSDTLERLAKQVRKRQFFRSQANAAVGMQRGSIYIIIFMLILMQFYMYYVYPSMIEAGLNSAIGWQVWQAGILVIMLGIFWVRQVTKIRV